MATQGFIQEPSSVTIREGLDEYPGSNQIDPSVKTEVQEEIRDASAKFVEPQSVKQVAELNDHLDTSNSRISNDESFSELAGVFKLANGEKMKDDHKDNGIDDRTVQGTGQSDPVEEQVEIAEEGLLMKESEMMNEKSEANSFSETMVDVQKISNSEEQEDAAENSIPSIAEHQESKNQEDGVNENGKSEMVYEEPKTTYEEEYTEKQVLEESINTDASSVKAQEIEAKSCEEMVKITERSEQDEASREVDGEPETSSKNKDTELDEGPSEIPVETVEQSLVESEHTVPQVSEEEMLSKEIVEDNLPEVSEGDKKEVTSPKEETAIIETESEVQTETKGESILNSHGNADSNYEEGSCVVLKEDVSEQPEIEEMKTQAQNVLLKPDKASEFLEDSEQEFQLDKTNDGIKPVLLSNQVKSPNEATIQDGESADDDRQYDSEAINTAETKCSEKEHSRDVEDSDQIPLGYQSEIVSSEVGNTITHDKAVETPDLSEKLIMENCESGEKVQNPSGALPFETTETEEKIHKEPEVAESESEEGSDTTKMTEFVMDQDVSRETLGEDIQTPLSEASFALKEVKKTEEEGGKEGGDVEDGTERILKVSETEDKLLVNEEEANVIGASENGIKDHTDQTELQELQILSAEESELRITSAAEKKEEKTSLAVEKNHDDEASDVKIQKEQDKEVEDPKDEVPSEAENIYEQKQAADLKEDETQEEPQDTTITELTETQDHVREEQVLSSDLASDSEDKKASVTDGKIDKEETEENEGGETLEATQKIPIVLSNETLDKEKQECPSDEQESAFTTETEENVPRELEISKEEPLESSDPTKTRELLTDQILPEETAEKFHVEPSVLSSSVDQVQETSTEAKETQGAKEGESTDQITPDEQLQILSSELSEEGNAEKVYEGSKATEDDDLSSTNASAEEETVKISETILQNTPESIKKEEISDISEQDVQVEMSKQVSEELERNGFEKVTDELVISGSEVAFETVEKSLVEETLARSLLTQPVNITNDGIDESSEDPNISKIAETPTDQKYLAEDKPDDTLELSLEENVLKTPTELMNIQDETEEREEPESEQLDGTRPVQDILSTEEPAETLEATEIPINLSNEMLDKEPALDYTEEKQECPSDEQEHSITTETKENVPKELEISKDEPLGSSDITKMTELLTDQILRQETAEKIQIESSVLSYPVDLVQETSTEAKKTQEEGTKEGESIDQTPPDEQLQSLSSDLGSPKEETVKISEETAQDDDVSKQVSEELERSASERVTDELVISESDAAFETVEKSPEEETSATSLPKQQANISKIAETPADQNLEDDKPDEQIPFQSLELSLEKNDLNLPTEAMNVQEETEEREEGKPEQYDGMCSVQDTANTAEPAVTLILPEEKPSEQIQSLVKQVLETQSEAEKTDERIREADLVDLETKDCPKAAERQIGTDDAVSIKQRIPEEEIYTENIQDPEVESNQKVVEPLTPKELDLTEPRIKSDESEIQEKQNVEAIAETEKCLLHEEQTQEPESDQEAKSSADQNLPTEVECSLKKQTEDTLIQEEKTLELETSFEEFSADQSLTEEGVNQKTHIESSVLPSVEDTRNVQEKDKDPFVQASLADTTADIKQETKDVEKREDEIAENAPDSFKELKPAETTQVMEILEKKLSQGNEEMKEEQKVQEPLLVPVILLGTVEQDLKTEDISANITSKEEVEEEKTVSVKLDKQVPVEDDSQEKQEAQTEDHSVDKPTMGIPARNSLSDLIEKAKVNISEVTDKHEKEKTEAKTRDFEGTERADEEDEEADENKEEGIVVMVESKESNNKTPHKKSHNILSGVGLKVKNSISKVKKAIIGKSSNPKPVSPK